MTPRPTDPSRTRLIATAAALACLAGVMLALTQAERPLGLILCLAAGVAVGWLGWRGPSSPVSQITAPPALPPEPEPALDEISPVLEGLPDPAMLIDVEGRIAASNAAVRRMLGFANSGMRLSAVLRRPELLDAAESAAQDGASLTVDYEVTAPVEEHFKVFCTPVVVSGRVAALMVFHDQTTAINTERMRADFLANASHELRTPLAALALLIETLAGHAKDDPVAQERFMKLMHVQIDRMRGLIDDLLSLSKIELNEHVPPADVIDLVALAQEVIDMTGPAAEERGVKLKLNAESPVLKVVGDRFQLVQVAQNLVDNAVKYSPPDALVEISLGAGLDREEAASKAGRQWAAASRISLLSPPPAAGQSYVFLRVSDNGPGIARRHLPRLSERFYRVERDEGAGQPGTGLGLAIVKHIVSRHRGGFIVESVPGQGSAFAVYVERAPAAAQPGAVPGAMAASAAPNPVRQAVSAPVPGPVVGSS